MPKGTRASSVWGIQPTVKRGGALRILHAPLNVAGQAWGLSRAERRLGVDSHLLVYEIPRFGYQYDQLVDKTAMSRRTRWMMWLKLLLHYDVYHFYFGRSLLRYHLDLPLLRLLGKKVVLTFQGCDARVARFQTGSGRWIDHGQYCSVCAARPVWRRRFALGLLARLATITYVLNPDLLFIVPRARLLPYTSVDIEAMRPVARREMNERLRVVHAPTNRRIKGTEVVVETINRLREEGVSIELVLLEGMDSDHVRTWLRLADVVVDQLNIGWYGGFAVEAMALAKPTVCFIDAEFTERAAIGIDIPIVRSTRDSLYETLKELAAAPEQLAELGEAGRRYVEAVHDPVEIAQRILRDLGLATAGRRQRSPSARDVSG